MDGVTLQRLLDSGRAFSPDQIIKILRQVLRALLPLHAKGILHGSIKPSNLFLCGANRVILGDLAVPLRGFSVQLDRLSYDYRYAASRDRFQQDGILGSMGPTSTPWVAWPMSWRVEHHRLSLTIPSSWLAGTLASPLSHLASVAAA